MGEYHRSRARCESCNHWFYADTLSPLKLRTLRWPCLICRRCLTEGLARIKGIKYEPIDGQFD